MENTSVFALLLDNKYSNAPPSMALMEMRYLNAPSLRFACSVYCDFRRADQPTIPVGIKLPILAGQHIHLQQPGQLFCIQTKARGSNIVTFFFSSAAPGSASSFVWTGHATPLQDWRNSGITPRVKCGIGASTRCRKAWWIVHLKNMFVQPVPTRTRQRKFADK